MRWRPSRIADQAGTILLYDGAACTRDRLRTRYGSHPRMRILSNFDEVSTASIDLIIASSLPVPFRSRTLMKC